MNKTPQKALVICNGVAPNQKHLTNYANECDFIICADGGANIARKAKLKPNLIIGDLDSIEPETKKYFSRVPTLLLQDQYSTDLEKALTYLVNRKFNSAIVVGATGKRLDHTMANYSIYSKYSKFISLLFIDEQATIHLVKNKIELIVERGQQISLSPLGKCTGVKTTGLQYPLFGETLAIGLREGISNIATSKKISVTVAKGELLLFVLRVTE
ncbi:MAG: thiamine diphosphokinase [Bacteroidetes bacterium]|nr:thiamine diphosphokinase [Bacteroidota bacterium]